jgi:hypothetical protein
MNQQYSTVISMPSFNENAADVVKQGFMWPVVDGCMERRGWHEAKTARASKS